jgi:enoyl-CoA hydratase
MMCDFILAADTATFGQPELGLGIIPGAGGTQRLPRIVGLGWAKHLILSGDIIDARQALAIGLVTAIIPASQLQVRARELARRMLRQGPLAARLAKLALNASARVDLDSGLIIETLAQAICYGSEDKLEGTTAFLEKRKARFTGG